MPGISVTIARMGSGILEIGTHCGHSSARMPLAVLAGGIIALEVGPMVVLIARSAAAFGGIIRAICLWAGHSMGLTPRLAAEWGIPGARSSSCSCRQAVGGAFLDERGSRFHEDLAQLD